MVVLLLPLLLLLLLLSFSLYLFLTLNVETPEQSSDPPCRHLSDQANRVIQKCKHELFDTGGRVSSIKQQCKVS